MYAISSLAESGVDGDQDTTGSRNAEVRLQHCRRVREQRGDAVALLESGVAERVGKPPRPLAELRVRVSPLAVDDGDLLRVHECRTGEQIDRVQLGAEHFRMHERSICPGTSREKRA